MDEPLRHRQTKEAATDMFYLLPGLASTLPLRDLGLRPARRSAPLVTVQRCRHLANRSKEAFDHWAESPVLQRDNHVGKPGQINWQRRDSVILGNQPPQHGAREHAEVRAAGD